MADLLLFVMSICLFWLHIDEVTKPMKDKYTVGSQWKTRGGWRAVVVSKDNRRDFLGVVYHDIPYEEKRRLDSDRHGMNLMHQDDGSLYPDEWRDYDLIEPWKEPRKGEFWVNVYDRGDKFDVGFGNKTK